MSVNQAEIFDTLEKMTQSLDKDEFIYAFLSAYGLPRSTITRLKNGDTRNIARVNGDIGLKKKLYFQPLPTGQDIYGAAENLKNSEIVRSNDIRFVIVTDFVNLVAFDVKADERLETPLNELHQQYGFFLPLAGYEKSTNHAESLADIKAAERMGQLFDLIRARNDLSKPEDIHALNVFLTRLLFCFFAEDTGIFKTQQFTDTIKAHTRDDGSDVDQFFYDLFTMLDTDTDDAKRKNTPAHLNAFPYVNGGLFMGDEPVPEFGAKARRLLLDCGSLDWSEINPDIFGSMFQAVIDESQRGNLGQHYTSVSNIMKVIQPLFLDKLYTELRKSADSEKRLQALLERITRIKVFDPGCGSGNFLIIAYKELRKFEMAVFKALNKIGRQNVIFMSGITLPQFHGIEIDDFAHEIALLSLWLAQHQMNQAFAAEFGHIEPMLPLKSSGKVVLGNSLRLDWNAVCPKSPNDEVYVIGNPPFLGSNRREDEHNADMAHVFLGFNNFKMLDFVACWFWKGAQYISGTRAELALVSTNSICQGEQVAMLWPYIFNLGLSIHFAFQSFTWKNSAKANAGVHVVVVGLSANPESKVIFKEINRQWHRFVASNISPYLLEGSNLSVMSRNRPLLNVMPMVYGNKPTDGGNLLLNRVERDELIAGEPLASRWIRKLYGAEEFLDAKERWCLWLEDANEPEIESVATIAERVSQVRAMRAKSKKQATRNLAEKPHLFGEIRQPNSGHYILVPAHSSENRAYVPMGFFDHTSVSSNANLMVPNGGLYEFAILNSTMHNDWMRTVCGRLESRYRYSATLVYNTFPWPETNKTQREAIERLAEEILLIREDYPDKTLADLYDPDKMPEPLKVAHKALDFSVEKLYRPRPFRDASERLEHLFARYEALIIAEQANPKSKRRAG